MAAAKAKTEYVPKATKCAVTKEQFLKHAKPILLRGTMDGQEFVLTLGVKEFSTGSFGWGASGDKGVLTIDGTPIKVQLGANFTVIGSKDAEG